MLGRAIPLAVFLILCARVGHTQVSGFHPAPSCPYEDSFCVWGQVFNATGSGGPGINPLPLMFSKTLAEEEKHIPSASLEQTEKTMDSFSRKWSFGAILGTTVTADYRAEQVDFVLFRDDNTQHIQSHRYLDGQTRLALGANIGLRINRNIVLQSSIIYHPLTELIEKSVENRTVSSSIWTDHVFDVPSVLCYEVNLPLRPFFGLGGVARIHDSLDPLFGGIASIIGINIGIRSIHIVPQVRYTRWIVDADSKTNRNQVQILISFSY